MKTIDQIIAEAERELDDIIKKIGEAHPGEDRASMVMSIIAAFSALISGIANKSDLMALGLDPDEVAGLIEASARQKLRGFIAVGHSPKKAEESFKKSVEDDIELYVRAVKEAEYHSLVNAYFIDLIQCLEKKIAIATTYKIISEKSAWGFVADALSQIAQIQEFRPASKTVAQPCM
jgi:hypothetical protein